MGRIASDCKAEDAMSTTVELVREGAIARVRFRSENGVQLFSAATRQHLAAALDEFEQWPACRVAVFEADGRTFIAGADIKELRALNPETADALAREGQQLMQRISRLRPVTVAAIHAACAGGGCELALACDLRMAAQSARIGLPEVSIGVLPGWGGTVRAVRLFGGAVARRMILSGELFPAEAALHLGLVDSVADDDAFRNAVESRLQMLLTRGPTALQAVKRLIADFEGPQIEEQLRAEAEAFAACYRSSDPVEGMTAFLEKRAPAWKT